MAEPEYEVTLDCGCKTITHYPGPGEGDTDDWCCPEHGDEVVGLEYKLITKGESK